MNSLFKILGVNTQFNAKNIYQKNIFASLKIGGFLKTIFFESETQNRRNQTEKVNRKS